MDNTLKVGDITKSVGYLNYNLEEIEEWPEFLPEGKHRISKVKDSLFGQLVQTDRCPYWLNYRWFKKVN